MSIYSHSEPMKILVVDDSDSDYFILKRVLSSFKEFHIQKRIVSGLDFEKHWENLIPEEVPNLILMDLFLPGLNGIQCLDLVKKSSYNHIPVIIYTTHSDSKEVKLAYQSFASGYIVKSLDFQALTTKLKDLLNYWVLTNELP